MPLPDKIENALRLRIGRVNTLIDDSSNREGRVAHCIHCSRSSKCEPCQKIIKKESEIRDELYSEIIELENFIRDYSENS